MQLPNPQMQQNTNMGSSFFEMAAGSSPLESAMLSLSSDPSMFSRDWTMVISGIVTSVLRLFLMCNRTGPQYSSKRPPRASLALSPTTSGSFCTQDATRARHWEPLSSEM